MAGEEANLAAAFPNLASHRDGGKGFNGMRCRNATTGENEVAKIRCANPTDGVSIVRFNSTAHRDAAIASNAEPEHFANDVCRLTSKEFEGQNPPAYYVAPSGNADLDTVLFIVNGANAANLRLQLPIC
ncbi:hypothetical protein JKI95_08430 [Corynebacterium aquatimens]|uniref:hypothetical protein n=1 Tax=Corynebacterium aquatimens TaxID=1190508 RepID=UPI00254011A7|nr:hypothetical protein [Corynebacterium aquatimens]QYH19227.1 hypothetical protein JKI95_08430 [Corynebacterium aquatimens]